MDSIKRLLHRNNIHSSTIQAEIHSSECSLCDQGKDCAADLPLLHSPACADFVSDDVECITWCFRGRVRSTGSQLEASWHGRAVKRATCPCCETHPLSVHFL